MRTEPLPSLPEMLDYAKKTWGYTDMTEEACFVDAFQNGEYHEEDTDLISLTDRLTNEELASLFLPVCKAMISGSVHHREGPTLKILMDCHAALAKWQRRHLNKPDDVLIPLRDVRQLLFEEVLRDKSVWWMAVVRHFEMLEAGVRRRMGVSYHVGVQSEYAAFEYQLRKLVGDI